ncbi:MAG: lysophospholipid acyltransferase family protein [Bacteroidales bacterium]|jgi:Kdo2-lipid IVA lauroyltransferase/acyltransferase|nr:lysophospholipid acyltransferase family protein [Bacteroidales bacterium]MCI1733127.1 lysophospholipid acyltransferase family protein [Bacteroidales bacterium]
MAKFLAEIRYILLYLISLLPLRVHYFFSDITSFILEHITRYRFTTITVNMSRSFPELKYKEIRKLVHNYYRFMSDVLFETIWDLAHSDAAICRVAHAENPEVVDALIAKHNKVLIVMGHLGNWELVSGMCGLNSHRTPDSFSSYPLYMVYKRAKNKISDAVFKKIRMHEYRKFQSKGEMIESHQVIRKILRDKEEKATFIMIADQNALGDNNLVVNFLNQPTQMLQGPEFVAVKMAMAVVYLGIDRISRGKYSIHFSTITEDGSKEEHGFITKKYAELLESDIKKNKVNWLWSHRRWKKNVSILRCK